MKTDFPKLGFFVLCLVIIESLLAATLIWSDLASGHKLVCVCMAVVMFFVVVGLGFALVWNRPNLPEGTHCTASKAAGESGSEPSMPRQTAACLRQGGEDRRGKAQG